MRRPSRHLLPLLALLAAALPSCEEDGSCAPACRPSADGQDIEVVLPCEGESYTTVETCNEKHNLVAESNAAGETEQFCTDVIQQRCEVRRYASGREFRICVVDAPVVGTVVLEADEDEARCAAVFEREAEVPEGEEPPEEPIIERHCVDCDHWWIDVRVDRRKADNELPEDCTPVPQTGFCDQEALGEYNFCGFEPQGCHWPPSPYL